MKSLKTIFLLAALALASPQASAAKIVFDPQNFAKNTIEAAQSVRQTAIQANQLATQTQQYMLMVRDLQQIDPGVLRAGLERGYLPAGAIAARTPAELIAAAAGVYSSYEQASAEMRAMAGIYGKIDTMMLELQRKAHVERTSIEDLLTKEAEAAAQSRSAAGRELTRLQEGLGQLRRHQARADEIAKALPTASGTVQLLQLVGAQNHLLADQVSQLIQTSTSTAGAAQNEAWLRAVERERSAEIARRAGQHNRATWQTLEPQK